MTLQAYCAECKKTVAAMTMLGGDEIRLAMKNHGEIRVMHQADSGVDHIWKLGTRDVENLRNNPDAKALLGIE